MCPFVADVVLPPAPPAVTLLDKVRTAANAYASKVNTALPSASDMLASNAAYTYDVATPTVTVDMAAYDNTQSSAGSPDTAEGDKIPAFQLSADVSPVLKIVPDTEADAGEQASS